MKEESKKIKDVDINSNKEDKNEIFQNKVKLFLKSI